MFRAPSLLLCFVLLSASVMAQNVRVKPVFFKPADQAEPDAAETSRLLKHLKIAQQRFREMLDGRDTFMLAGEQIEVYRSPRNLSYFETASDGGARAYTVELLQHYGLKQDSCPYVFVIVLMNARRDYPAGGGRPINGGANNGGGIVILSSFALNWSSRFQSTLQHELGHSFGLPHVDVYGYSMKTNRSVMSYNPAHHWNHFSPPQDPGQLIPEDVYALSKNRQVFSKLAFDERRDVPLGYQRHKPVYFGKMDLSSRSQVDLEVSGQGFELFWNARRVGHEPDWAFADAVSNLQWNQAEYPEKAVRGFYEGVEVVVAGKGYELYHDYERVGHEPRWTFVDGVSNLNRNRRAHRDRAVHGFYQGQLIEVSGRGYELYFGHKRVGHEAGWSQQQGMRNLRGNIRNHPETNVTAFYDGQLLTP